MKQIQMQLELLAFLMPILLSHDESAKIQRTGMMMLRKKTLCHFHHSVYCQKSYVGGQRLLLDQMRRMRTHFQLMPGKEMHQQHQTKHQSFLLECENEDGVKKDGEQLQRRVGQRQRQLVDTEMVILQHFQYGWYVHVLVLQQPKQLLQLREMRTRKMFPFRIFLKVLLFSLAFFESQYLTPRIYR